MKGLFEGLPPEQSAAFERRMTRSTYEPDQLVLDFEDVSTDVFFIESGAVRVVVRNAGGREVILGDLAEGQIFGDMAAIDAAPRSASITALYRSTVARMAGDTFVELATHTPLVAHRLMKVLTERIRIGNAKLLELSTLSLRYRLHAELLREARPRASAPGELAISPPPLQHVLAARIGGRREAVSREMAELARQGLIRRTAAALVLTRPEVLRADLARQLQD